jgi:6-phosphogluconolactonase
VVDQLIPRLEIQPLPESTARVAAAFLAERLERADRENGRSRLALCGGSTPATTYSVLAPILRSSSWGPRVEFYWGDERFVPPSSPLSNFQLANSTLLVPAGVSPDRIHRVVTEGVTDADAAALGYEATLRRQPGFGLSTFDVAIQGIGPDGHTASLFPGERALVGGDRWVIGVAESPQPPHVPRISMSLSGLNRSRTVVLLAAGEEKASIVRQALAPACDGVPLLPAAQVHGTDETVWFLDEAAAAKLPQ